MGLHQEAVQEGKFGVWLPHRFQLSLGRGDVPAQHGNR
jgi:hypothetical protein